MRLNAPAVFKATLAALLCALFAVPVQAQIIPPAQTGGTAFHHVDTDSDGRVTLDEVLAYAKKQRADATPFRVGDVDLNRDGILTPEELKKAGVKGFEGQGAIKARELDLSGDGYVSREDLDEYFARKHRADYVRADADKDGSLKASEFVLFRFQ